jgi:hypothetical protein
MAVEVPGWVALAFFTFLGLKLAGAVSWSWWWVTAPLWGVPAAVIAVFAVVQLASAIRKIARRQ